MNRTHASVRETPVSDLASSASKVNLSDPDFWKRPRAERDAAFELLRLDLPVSRQPAPTAWSLPQFPAPAEYWAVTRHKDIRAASRDPQTYICGKGVFIFTQNFPDELRYIYEGLLCLDGDRHKQLRQLTSTAFGPRMMRRLDEWMQKQAREKIASVAERGECDFYGDLVRMYPVDVICELLGVPPADRESLMATAQTATSLGVHGITPERAVQAGKELVDYGIELGRYRRKIPADDMITGLASVEIDGERLSDLDLGATFALTFGGGAETAGLTATAGMFALSQNTDQRSRLQSEYERFEDTACEEMLRWGSPVVALRRVASCDTHIGGHAIPEGDEIVFFLQSGNRDEAAFKAAKKFDVGRHPNPHLAFGGGGVHFCLGNALARLELKVFFKELFRLLPDIEVSGQPTVTCNPLLDVIDSLPCVFTPTKVS